MTVVMTVIMMVQLIVAVYMYMLHKTMYIPFMFHDSFGEVETTFAAFSTEQFFPLSVLFTTHFMCHFIILCFETFLAKFAIHFLLFYFCTFLNVSSNFGPL